MTKKRNLKPKVKPEAEDIVIERFGTVTMPDGATISMAKINMSDVIFNPYNPNVMDEKTFSALKSNIKETKYLELAVVLYDREGGKFECIDGEHRLFALKDMGITEPIVSLVEGGVSSLQAYSGAYTFNKIRGQISSDKLAKMLKFGTESWGAKQVLKSFGMQKYKYDEIMLQFQEETETSTEDAIGATTDHKKKMEKIADSIMTEQVELKSKTFEETTQLIMINLKPKKHKIVTSVLASINPDISEALYLICKKHKGKDYS